MRYNEALKEIQFNKVRKFILTGEETYLKERFIEVFIAAHPDCHFLKFYPGDEKEVKSSLFSSSLFGDQIVILKYYDDMKNKGLKDLIKTYDGYLILSLTEDANLKSSVVSEMLGLCAHVQCSRMPIYGPEYPSWISSKASEKEYVFVDGAEDAFYKKVGPDMLTMVNELEKLMIFKNFSKSITPDDIEKIVTSTASGTVFNILECLLQKDIPNTLKYVDLYLRDNDNIEEIILFLSNFFEKLYRMLVLHYSGSSVESIASILNIPAFIVRNKYLPRAVSFGKEKIADYISQLCILSVDIRTSNIKKNLLDKFIFSFNF